MREGKALLRTPPTTDRGREVKTPGEEKRNLLAGKHLLTNTIGLVKAPFQEDRKKKRKR